MTVKLTERLDGFVIQGPGHPLHMCFSTFAPTMGEAWTRFIGFRERPPGELALMKGRWRAKGWRPVPASLCLSPEAPASSKEEGYPGGKGSREARRPGAAVSNR